MCINYWHMNLHPTDGRMIDNDIRNIVLGRTIGMGIWEKPAGVKARTDFKNRMTIGDIVCVLNGQTPIALVEVIGDCYEFADSLHRELDVQSIIWFVLRRPVKILCLKDTFKKDFPMRTKTLTIAVNPNTKTYKYIDSWFNQCKKINLVRS